MKTLLHAADREELMHRLAQLRPDSARLWGKMSADQMVCHLNDTFRVLLGEKTAQSLDTWFSRTVIKWVALWFPMNWPHGLPTLPEVDQERGGTSPKEFAGEVAQLRALVDRYCAIQGGEGLHPMFGRISVAERMRHAYLHMDHHFRQFGV